MALEQVFLFVGLFLVIAGVAILALKVVKIVRPYERGVIERVGKYKRTVNPGVTFLLPFMEDIIKIDLRERVIDVPPQDVITKDDAVVVVDAVVYFEVINPVRVVYNVKDFRFATTKLAQTSLRDIIGSMELDETLISREMINTRLREILDEATDRWGVNITRVELQKIEPPQDLVEAMARQMKAERSKRAAIKEAEGIKRSEILKSEGKAEAIQKLAEADRYKKIAVADGQSKAIQDVYSAIHKGMPTKDLIAIKYLETLEKMADGKATKLFLPMESSGILGSLGGLRELFRREDKEQTTETFKRVKRVEKKKAKIEKPEEEKS